MAYTVMFDDYLEIGGVPLNTPAWTHTDLWETLGYADMRGANRVVPGSIGVRPLPRRPTETQKTATLVIYGDRRPDGTTWADPIAGLAANLEHLVENILDPLAVTNALRPAVLHLGENTYTADVQVIGFAVTEAFSPACVQASLDVNFLRGSFFV